MVFVYIKHREDNMINVLLSENLQHSVINQSVGEMALYYI